MGRRRKTREATVVLTEEQKHHRIADGFAEVFRLEQQILALIAEHIQPLKDAKTKSWRAIKAETGTEAADLDIAYRLFKRRQIAEDMESAEDRDRVFDNLRRAFGGLRVGETLDFLDALTAGSSADDDMFEEADREAVEVAGPDADADRDATDPDAEAGEEAARPETDAENKPKAAEPGADWGKGDAAEDPELDGAGHVFNAGLAAGRDGHGPEVNPHPDATTKALMWERGRAKGASEKTSDGDIPEFLDRRAKKAAGGRGGRVAADAVH